MRVRARGALLLSYDDYQLSTIIEMLTSFIINAIGHSFSRSDRRIRDYSVKGGVYVAVNVAGDDLDLTFEAKQAGIRFCKVEGSEVDVAHGDVSFRIEVSKD